MSIIYFNKNKRKFCIKLESEKKIRLFGWIEIAKGNRRELMKFINKVEKLNPFLILKNADIKLLWKFFENK